MKVKLPSSSSQSRPKTRIVVPGTRKMASGEALVEKLQIPHRHLLMESGYAAKSVLGLLKFDVPWLFLHGENYPRKDRLRASKQKPRSLKGLIKKYVQGTIRSPFISDPRILPKGIAYQSEFVNHLMTSLLVFFKETFNEVNNHGTKEIPLWANEIRFEKQRLQIVADILNWRIEYEIDKLIRSMKLDRKMMRQIKAPAIPDEDIVVSRLRFQYVNLLQAKKKKKKRFTISSLKMRLSRP